MGPKKNREKLFGQSIGHSCLSMYCPLRLFYICSVLPRMMLVVVKNILSTGQTTRFREMAIFTCVQCFRIFPVSRYPRLIKNY